MALLMTMRFRLAVLAAASFPSCLQLSRSRIARTRAGPLPGCASSASGIADIGGVITSGGATAFLNLVLYLMERFAGHDRANLAAKVPRRGVSA